LSALSTFSRFDRSKQIARLMPIAGMPIHSSNPVKRPSFSDQFLPQISATGFRPWGRARNLSTTLRNSRAQIASRIRHRVVAQKQTINK
jgi:hypothetical protein